MVTNKYPEDNIIWHVIGLDVYKELKAKLKPNNRRDVRTSNLRLDVFTNKCWTEFNSKYTKDEKYLVINDNYVIHAYRCKLHVAHVDDNMSHKAVSALSKVREKFQELTNSSFKRSFGTANKNILRCIPKQFYWANSTPYVGNINSVDYSSQYPSNLGGLLPDSHGAIEIKGTVKPTKEYPFAFYINSGHMAIYNEFDTHYWIYSKFKDYLFRYKTYRKDYDDTFKDILPDEDVTVLMKASKDTLKETYEYFYNIKQTFEKNSPEYNEAKLVLNASIGQMHRKRYEKDDKYAHLAAVTIARSNNNMLLLTKPLKISDIVQIQVDGILYKGDLKLGVDDVYFGAPVQEAYNNPCRWDRLGVYMIITDNKCIIKHQGLNAMTDGRDIEESTKFSDMNLWYNKGEEDEKED